MVNGGKGELFELVDMVVFQSQSRLLANKGTCAVLWRYEAEMNV
jgi:hypothetical protein